MSYTSLELRSEITPEGQLRLQIGEREVEPPGPDDVIVRVEAAPLNPSDLNQLLSVANLTTLKAGGTDDRPVAIADIPEQMRGFTAPRIGQSLTFGNEGAGVVVDAGVNAQHLVGAVVSAAAGAMYTQFRKLPASDVLPFAAGVTPAQAASSFVNPMTALGMISTMRLEGHAALVHTAAASNLGQMLNKLCLTDGIDVVNVVRSAEQERILRDLGAPYVVNSTASDFDDRLTDAIAATGATLVFDAVGGGDLGGRILATMEAVLLAKTPAIGPYGSPVRKQLYVYGRLDRSPTTVPISVGMAWSAGGWLLTYHLMRIGPEETRKLRMRVAEEIATTFASSYTAELSFIEALDPAAIHRYGRMATGEKFLLRPHGAES